MKNVRFASIKGDEDRTTLIVEGYKSVGYYDHSWARLGGVQYRYSDDQGSLRANTRGEIERLITNRLQHGS